MGLRDEYNLDLVEEENTVPYELDDDAHYEEVVAPVERYAEEARAALEGDDADTDFLETVERGLHVGSGAVADFRRTVVETYEEEGVDPLVASEELREAAEAAANPGRDIDFSSIVEQARETAEARS